MLPFRGGQFFTAKVGPLPITIAVAYVFSNELELSDRSSPTNDLFDHLDVSDQGWLCQTHDRGADMRTVFDHDEPPDFQTGRIRICPLSLFPKFLAPGDLSRDLSCLVVGRPVAADRRFLEIGFTDWDCGGNGWYLRVGLVHSDTSDSDLEYGGHIDTPLSGFDPDSRIRSVDHAISSPPG